MMSTVTSYSNIHLATSIKGIKTLKFCLHFKTVAIFRASLLSRLYVTVILERYQTHVFENPAVTANQVNVGTEHKNFSYRRKNTDNLRASCLVWSFEYLSLRTFYVSQ